MKKKKPDGTSVIEGEVVEFNEATCFGMIVCADDQLVHFHSTSFQSFPSTRFPRVGDIVDVIFYESELLRIRTKKVVSVRERNKEDGR